MTEFENLAFSKLMSLKYPCTFNGTQTLNTQQDLFDILDSIFNMTDEEFIATYPTMEFKFKALCTTTSVLYSKQDVKEIGYSAFSDNNQITSISIPGSIETMQYGAFMKCSNLQTVVIEDGAKIIGKHAFYNCNNLTSVTIANSVTKIEDYAFADCSSLGSITISEGITELVGGSTFYGCSSLATVIIDSSTIAALESSNSKLLTNASTVYVKTGLTVGSYITGSFTKQGSSDKAGYDMYTKN